MRLESSSKSKLSCAYLCLYGKYYGAKIKGNLFNSISRFNKFTEQKYFLSPPLGSPFEQIC